MARSTPALQAEEDRPWHPEISFETFTLVSIGDMSSILTDFIDCLQEYHYIRL